MKKLPILLFIFCIYQISWSQFSDDFSDLNLSQNPTWIGDTNHFRVDNNQLLQLYNLAPASNNNSIIVTNSESIDNASWKFNFRLNFTPSSSNFARVYLVSNTSSLNGNVNGYLVELGRVNRKIALCKQSGTTVTEIISSPIDVLNLATNAGFIEVQRDAQGNWQLEYDTSSTFTNPQHAGNIQDTTHRFSKFFGINCRYSTTRAQHFFFDNFDVTGNAYIDTSSFWVQEINIENDSQLVLLFSKMIDPTNASNTLNFTASQGMGNPISAQILSNPMQMRLTFANPIGFSTLYHLQIQQITDIFGNALQNNNFPFYRIARNDLIINEIMVNPNGSPDLPSYRYIEIFNRLNFAVHLKNWKIHVGATPRVISESVIPAHQYLVITDSAAMHLYANINIAYLQPFFSLNSTGATVRLWNNKNKTIDSVTYSAAFYQNCMAAQGGFSLERINPSDFCQQAYNWKTTTNARGGTPGFPNEVKNENFAALKVISSEVISPTEVLLTFNRILDTNSIHPTSFSFAGNSISSLQRKSQQSWLLQLTQALPENINAILTIHNLQDSCHLVAPIDTSFTIANYVPKQNDVVINELHFRTIPVVGLPDVQYIELKNRTSFPISVANWELKINNSSYTLPAGIIEPDSFLLIIRRRSVFQDNFPDVAVLYTCDAINLSVSGARVSLLSKDGSLMNSVQYSELWHASNKRNGGWSLELMDANASCVGKNAWQSSRDSLGGTPGKRNSWEKNIAFAEPNYITNFGINGADSIILYLHRAVLENSFDSLDFVLQPNQLFPEKIDYSTPESNKIYLKFPLQFQQNTAYQLHIANSASDCMGNKVEKDTIHFELAKPIETQELLINEILFNPKINGVDFVEIYNNSNHFIDLKNSYLGNYDTLTKEPLNQRIIHSESLYLTPGKYLVLSLNKDTVLSHYLSPNKRKGFWNVASMPSFSNSEGSVSLSAVNLKIYDAMHYTEKWHFNLLTDVKGTSLERIFFNLPSSQPSNWHSAASTVGYATPAYKNSQFGNSQSMAAQWISLPSEFISPDLDGYQDFLEIQYKIPEAGYVGTFKILTAQGILVKTIQENTLLASDGILIWDGLNENGEKAKTGIHVLQVEFLHPEGKTHLVKKTFVVAAKL